jgi:two-component system sensor histidine kinase/response regulator
MTPDPLRTTIMIIDDEAENLNVLEDMLRQENWDVRAFPAGDLALEAARDEPPDLVLLDIRMPGLDGYEVCRRFKADERLRAVPVIFLSAFAETADKVRAFTAGGVDYVTKPFAAIEVLSRTRTHLRLSRHQLRLEELVRQRVHELTDAHRRLRIWDDAKTQWLNTLSHEMRTPLTGVFGIAELLFMELPADSACRPLRHDYDVSRNRIEKLMDDALTLAEIDVATDSFAAKPLRLAPVLKDALETFALKHPGFPVRAALAAAEPVVVSGESTLLKRAIGDLLLTAAQCNQDGHPLALEARVAPAEAIIAIGTTGGSLSPEAIETFFEVGGQRTLLKGGGDWGLAAALANRIARLFNGRVTARSGAESGLVLEIALPLASGSARPGDPAQ